MDITLSSIYAQIYPSVEVMVLDSSNHPEDTAVLERWKHKLDMKVFYQDRRKPLGWAYNFLLNRLSEDTEYVVFFSSDDYFGCKSRIERQVHYLETHPEVDFCYTGYHVYRDGEYLRTVQPPEERDFKYDSTSIITMMWRYSSIAGLGFSTQQYGEDLSFVHDALTMGLIPGKCSDCLDIRWMIWSTNSKLLRGKEAGKWAGKDSQDC